MQESNSIIEFSLFPVPTDMLKALKGYYDIVREGYEDCRLDTNVLDQAVQTSMDLAKERMEYGGMQLF